MQSPKHAPVGFAELAHDDADAPARGHHRNKAIFAVVFALALVGAAVATVGTDGNGLRASANGKGGAKAGADGAGLAPTPTTPTAITGQARPRPTRLPASARPQRIVGGFVVSPAGKFPFMVSLQFGGLGHFCGGSLVRPDVVLTAAHCVDDASLDAVRNSTGGGLTVHVGRHNMEAASPTDDRADAEVINVTKVVRHCAYNAENSDNDVALLQLARRSAFAPIALNFGEDAAKLDSPQVTSTAR